MTGNNITSAAANRQRLHVERQRAGLVCLPVLVLEVDTIEVLRAEGFLSDQDLALEDAKQRREAIAKALSQWTYREMTRHEQALWPEV